MVVSLNCPKYPETEMKKNWLDNYYCPECDHDWLIHPFKNIRKGYRSK